LISGSSGALPTAPALLGHQPMHQFWPDGLSLLNKSGIDACLGRCLRMLKAQLKQVLWLYLMAVLPWRPGKATDLRERCQNIRTVQELLGHKNANS
jgi:hypothetical protein